jgi:drug/metabolite transporter (DMT)-like permease
VLMSWLFLDEIPGWLTLAGGALCLAGVAVSRRTAARAAETTDRLISTG